MPNPAKDFFEGSASADGFFESVLDKVMHDLGFYNPLVQMYLAGLLCSFVRNGESVFHVRRDPALAIQLLQADLRQTIVLGDKLLFGLGVFPEHFVATGKHTVGLNVYRNILEGIIVKRLAVEMPAWREIGDNFVPTLQSLAGVRKQVTLSPSASRTIIRIPENAKDNP